MAWTLCSKQDVTSIHPINEGELEDAWSDFTEAFILQHMGNPFIGTPSAVADEYHNGDGSDILLVKQPPIVSVTSLEVDGSVLTAADYIVFPNYIQLKALKFTRGRLNVKLSYTSGIAAADVEDTVRLAAALMVVAFINYRGRMGADSTMKFAGSKMMNEENANGRTPNVNIGLLTHLKAIMRSTIRRRKVRAS